MVCSFTTHHRLSLYLSLCVLLSAQRDDPMPYTKHYLWEWCCDNVEFYWVLHLPHSTFLSLCIRYAVCVCMFVVFVATADADVVVVVRYCLPSLLTYTLSIQHLSLLRHTFRMLGFGFISATHRWEYFFVVPSMPYHQSVDFCWLPMMVTI